MTKAIDKKSLKELAEMVVSGKLLLNQFYAAAIAKNIATERAETLLIETRARLEAQRMRQLAQSELFAARILDARGKLTAGRAIGLGLGRKAVTR